MRRGAESGGGDAGGESPPKAPHRGLTVGIPGKAAWRERCRRRFHSCLCKNLSEPGFNALPVWRGSQGFPFGKSAPFSWLAARRATPPPGTGKKSSDGEDEGKRHASSQLNVQEFHRGRMKRRGADWDLFTSVWKPLPCKSASPA